MIYIDKIGPNGNIYNILGIFKNYITQLKRAGIDVTEQEKLLKDFKNMTYEQILEDITKLSRGYIIFHDGDIKRKDTYL